jgi:glycosyltransferase involved in cell wall biosynthesis
MDRHAFEVVLIEDRGGTESGRAAAQRLSSLLQIVYAPLDKNYGVMGYSRNYGLSCSRGEIVLFLDDDTVVLQQNFLQELLRLFERHRDIHAIIPHGIASYALRKDRYDFHDPYFMTSRCMAYRRSALTELGGFISSFIGQEDVEFTIRFALAKKKAVTAEQLTYYHPPLTTPNLKKPMAVGFSCYNLKRQYSFPLWVLVLLNGCRHIPLLAIPSRKFREMGRFGLGFLMGVWAGMIRQNGIEYR